MDNDISSMYPSVFTYSRASKPVLSYGEARHMGARLYSVLPLGYNWLELEQWCTEMFGPVSSLWDPRLGNWYMNDSQIMFRDEADRTLFALRWE